MESGIAPTKKVEGKDKGKGKEKEKEVGKKGKGKGREREWIPWESGEEKLMIRVSSWEEQSGHEDDERLAFSLLWDAHGSVRCTG